MSRGKSLAYKPGAGENRDYHGIKAFMDVEKITIQDVAEAEGVHHSIVSHTIRGTKNNRRVLKRLVEMGCPIKILSLPDDMKNQARH